MHRMPRRSWILRICRSPMRPRAPRRARRLRSRLPQAAYGRVEERGAVERAVVCDDREAQIVADARDDHPCVIERRRRREDAQIGQAQGGALGPGEGATECGEIAQREEERALERGVALLATDLSRRVE